MRSTKFIHRRRSGFAALALLLALFSLHGSDLRAQEGDGDTIYLPLLQNGGQPDNGSLPAAPDTSELPQIESPDASQVVAKVHFENATQLAALINEYDVWEEAIPAEQRFVTVMLSPNGVETLSAAGYRVEIDEERTARLGHALLFGHAHDAETEALLSSADILSIPGYSCYRTVEETYSSLAQLATDNPTLATWTDIGNTYDKATPGGPSGYDIFALKLTNSATDGATAGAKPKLMIISAIHAREYTTAELTTRFAEYLVGNYGIDADATWLLDYHEVHIIAQANPDGRKIAEGGDLWRKNTNPGYGCAGGNYGVDLNRNSSFQWGGSGSSGNTCSQTYRGPSPASEIEVQVIQDYAANIFADQRGPGINDAAPANTSGVFISIHSYSELVLYPWGWSNNPAPNNGGLATLGRKFGFFNGYEVCNDCLYIADGTTDDWTYGELGVASYTFELGTAFFQDCATFENQIVPDNLPALVYAAKAARRPYQTPSGPDAVNLSLSQPVVAAGTAVDLAAVVDDTRSDSNGQGSDPTQAISAARYSIDTPSWRGGTTFPMSAADGSFSSTAESVTASVDTSGLSDGPHTLFVEGRDASGQWGVASAIFLEIGTPPTTVFFDDFESSGGWATNPSGSDPATTGQWEIGDPQATNSNGPKQLGNAFSGTRDLVTARLAGSSVGTNDIDSGQTSVRSPNVTIPTAGDETLSFAYYMAHTSNSSNADYLRVKVVGSSTQTVFEELGAANDDDAAWEIFSTDISAFAGQTIYLLVEAADAAGGSIVEAALDDVRITSTATGVSTNQPPTANAGPNQTVTDSDGNGAESVSLDGRGSSDSDGSIVSYVWQSDSGVTIPNGATPAASFPVGVHNVTLTVTDDDGASASDTVVVTVNAASASTTIFADDFESNTGWSTNPNGSDTATTGQWQVGNPEQTTYQGAKQLGSTVSGTRDLVTARLAGSSVGTNDIDGGVTSVRSPSFAIPAGSSATLSFSYYMAHTSNSSSADFLRVKVVGSSTATVLEELGAGNDDDAAWQTFSADISGFAGQTVYLLVEAADAANGSIVEAALDDVLVEATQ